MKNNENKILIITTSFSPENSVGSIRLTKIVKYLIRQGFDITTISPKLHTFSKIDNSLECKELNIVNRIQIGQSSFFSKSFLKQRNNFLKKKSATEIIKNDNKKGYINQIKTEIFKYIHFSYTILRNLDWKYQVVKYIKLNFSKNQFHVVFSSYPSLGAPWSAKYIKNHQIASLWICDFRDPINYENNSNFILFKLNTIIQNNIMNNSSYITYISKGISKKFNSKFLNKSIYLSNGFDMDDINKVNFDNKNVLSKRTLIISYVGSLYGGQRSVKPLFKAIKELIKLNNNLKIKFIYAGKEFNILHAQASFYGVEYLLENRGFITRAEAISIQAYSDVIVVSTWNTEKDQGILTGKLYECFLTKKPIIALINGSKPNSELSEIVSIVGGGVYLEEASLDYKKEYSKLLSFLLAKCKEKSEMGCVKNTYNEKIEQYEYVNITSKLSSIFSKKKI